MLNKHYIYVLLISLSFLISCASSQSKKDSASLTTTIAEDGSKRFVYSIDLRQRVGKFSDYQRGVPRREKGLLPTSLKRIEKELKRRIKATGFCETGYFIYDNRYRNARFELAGECNESSLKEQS